MSRQLLARTLVVLASVSIVLALVVGYVRRAAVDSDQFANRATAALRTTACARSSRRGSPTRSSSRTRSDLLAARPIIESVASSRRRQPRVHRACSAPPSATCTGAVFDRDQDTRHADRRRRRHRARARRSRSCARRSPTQVEATGRVELVKRDLGRVSGDLARARRRRPRARARCCWCSRSLLVAGALCCSPDRRRTVVELGIGAAVAGVLLVVAYGVLRSLALDHVDGPESRAAAGAVWDAFLGDLRTAGVDPRRRPAR